MLMVYVQKLSEFSKFSCILILVDFPCMMSAMFSDKNSFGGENYTDRPHSLDSDDPLVFTIGFLAISNQNKHLYYALKYTTFHVAHKMGFLI